MHPKIGYPRPSITPIPVLGLPRSLAQKHPPNKREEPCEEPLRKEKSQRNPLVDFWCTPEEHSDPWVNQTKSDSDCTLLYIEKHSISNGNHTKSDFGHT